MDSGSSDNLVSEEMVHNLGLKRFKHPYPYGISWFLDEHMVEGKDKYLVNFRIGPYRDEVM